MLITNKQTLRQVLANIRLEHLSLPLEVQDMFNKALNGEDVDTVEVVNILKRISAERKEKIDSQAEQQ